LAGEPHRSNWRRDGKRFGRRHPANAFDHAAIWRRAVSPA
jgi:hypothetical protein